MGSVDVDDDIAEAIQAKKVCLEKATKILLEDDSADSKINSRNAEYIDSLKDIYDLLQTTLSKSTPNFIYSQFHHLRWPTKGNQSKINVDKERIRKTIQLEVDLYRAMWLNCLILLSITNSSKRKQHYHRRKRRKVNNPTCDDSRQITLQRTIDQCRVLTQLLQQVSLAPESNTEVSDHINGGMWDERIRKWAKSSNIDEEDDEDDESFNMLSFTKEQLAAEEQQLLVMAETPIPTANRYSYEQQQQQEKKYTTTDKSIDDNATDATKPLVGRLVATADEASSSQSTVAIHMDDRGSLRAKDASNKDSCWWSLTSKSVIHCEDNKSSTNIQITNVISIKTAEVTTITLDVGKESTRWVEQISSFQANNKRHGSEVLEEAQEEIMKLWTDKEVETSQNKARELFARVLRAVE